MAAYSPHHWGPYPPPIPPPPPTGSPWPFHHQPFLTPAQQLLPLQHTNDPWDHPSVPNPMWPVPVAAPNPPPSTPWGNPPSPWNWTTSHPPLWANPDVPLPPDPRMHQAHMWPWMAGGHTPPWWAGPPGPFPRMRDTDAMVRPADFPRDDLPPLVDPEPAMNPPPTPGQAPAWPLVPFQQPGIAPPIFPNPAPQPPPAFIQPIVLTTTYYDRTNPPRRPPDWRRNYVPIGRRFRALSIMCRCEDKISPPLEHCHLTHTLLMPNDKTPVMTLDLRSDLPLLDPERLELLTTTSRRPSNETDLMQRATIQPVDHIRIMHDALPWLIDIHAQSPDNGILVKDILEQTLAALQTPITTSEYYTEVLNADDRERIAEAYRERAGGRVDVLQRGVLRVDYLGKDWLLSGFVEGRRGVWEMKTRSIDGT